ncbi:MAG: formaldehyde-activating enzyme [Thermoproteota archaeon]|nr:MAG: formaldehyde-activating enzyme [Candidatus Korarchaeota archaeon]RLG55326.1 MAG: formaldehyde-activating enzyme [Candidatus Korarchaeota archaeon]
MMLIGEALVGKEPEIAHIDLVIGSKDGPVGQAFAAGLAHCSAGHTPLLAVIRPNLPCKPFTLIIPKVTVRNMRDAEKIFGPAQAAVAKAIADAVEEGIIPRDKVDDWVIICSVFIHPQAKDYRRIYHYNYSATKLALKRAMQAYPSLEKIMYDKDRAIHPVLGYRVPRLWNPPYLQIALDIPSLSRIIEVVKQIPKSDTIILEAGTPLIKRYGASVIRQLREVAPDVFIVADLKTLDVGKVEVDIAFEETADGVVASGLAPVETLNKFVYEADRLGIYSFIDMLGVSDPLSVLEKLEKLPSGVIVHRGVDEAGRDIRWHLVKKIREAYGRKLLIAVAGGIVPENVREALRLGADIVIVGRYITQSRDVERAVREFLMEFEKRELDIDLFREHVE